MNTEESRMPARQPGEDKDLRAALRATLPQADDASLAPLQSRVLAQWRTRVRPASHPLPLGGGVAGLRQGLFHHPILTMAGLALAVAIAGSVYLKRGDPALEELREPDVLSLIMIGEL